MFGQKHKGSAAEPRKTVLFVGGSLLPFCRFRRRLIETLIDEKNCRVICAFWGDSEDGVFQRFELPGITWVNLGGDHASTPGFRDIKPLWLLFRMIAKHKPTAICCFNAKPIALTSFIARIGSPKARRVALMEGLGTSLAFLATENNSVKKTIFKLLTRNFQRWILLNRRDVSLIEGIHSGSISKVTHISGVGTDLSEFLPSVDPLSERRLIFVGRLVPEKGVDFFLDLARHVREEGMDWRFSIAGIAPKHNKLTNRNIDLSLERGYVEDCGAIIDMSGYYRKSSILVFPSRYEEGLPAAIMEAQASGLPCLVLDRPAVREAIIDGKTGFLLPDLDPKLWVEKLHALSDPDLFRSFSRAAREYASAVYDQNLTNKRIISVLLDE